MGAAGSCERLDTVALRARIPARSFWLRRLVNSEISDATYGRCRRPPKTCCVWLTCLRALSLLLSLSLSLSPHPHTHPPTYPTSPLGRRIPHTDAERYECLTAAHPALEGKLTYPTDAEAHFEEVHTQLKNWTTDIKMHYAAKYVCEPPLPPSEDGLPLRSNRGFIGSVVPANNTLFYYIF